MMEDNVANNPKSDMKITPILPPSITSPTIPTVPGYCIKIYNKKLLSALISCVNKRFPLPSYKRVIQLNGSTVLLVGKVDQISAYQEDQVSSRLKTEPKFVENCDSECIENEEKDILQSDIFQTITNLFEPLISGFAEEEITEVTLPSTLPNTKLQHKNCTWPTSFHPNKDLEKVLSGNNFSLSEKLTIFNRIRSVKELSSAKSQIASTFINCVMIVDPNTDTELTVSHTNPCNILKHATICAVDEIAIIQKSNSDNISLTNANHNDTTDSAEAKNCYLAGPQPEGKRKIPESDTNNTTKKQKTDSQEREYLCTGYDIYLAREPCIMCSMALVHSRIRRVFFSTERGDFGGLVSQTRLQDIASLNHRFEVYQVS